MNEITSELTKSMYPITALVFYGCADSRPYYVERRDLIDGQMGAGFPLSEECLSDLLSVFKKKNNLETESKQLRGVMPNNILFLDTRVSNPSMIWYRLPEKRYFFSKGLGLEDGEIQVPGMVYKVVNNHLFVFAFKVKRKPTIKTKIYAAPFFNIAFDSGKVCLGSATRMKDNNTYTYIERMEYYESLFWGSEFTHLGSGGNPTRSNLVNVIRKLIDTKCSFPLEELKPMRNARKVLTLENILL